VYKPSASALLLVIRALLGAQSTSASMSGRVTDPSNALIADAKVAAIGSGTNRHHAARRDLIHTRGYSSIVFLYVFWNNPTGEEVMKALVRPHHLLPGSG
jgi:hypothetical protein